MDRFLVKENKKTGEKGVQLETLDLASGSMTHQFEGRKGVTQG